MTQPLRPSQQNKVVKMEDYKKSASLNAKPKAATVTVAAMAMALENQKRKYEVEIEALKQQLARPAALKPAAKTKRNGEAYNNVPGSKRDRRYQRQLDKVLSGVRNGTLRGKMHREDEVMGQSTIRNYLKEQGLPCGSEHAGTFQQQLIKAGLAEMRSGKVVIILQAEGLARAA